MGYICDGQSKSDLGSVESVQTVLAEWDSFIHSGFAGRRYKMNKMGEIEVAGIPREITKRSVLVSTLSISNQDTGCLLRKKT